MGHPQEGGSSLQRMNNNIHMMSDDSLMTLYDNQQQIRAQHDHPKHKFNRIAAWLFVGHSENFSLLFPSLATLKQAENDAMQEVDVLKRWFWSSG